MTFVILLSFVISRKKPAGKLLQSAHDVEREFQVLNALGTYTLGLVPKGLAPNRRNQIYSATAKALASLHSADIDAIGLGKYGRRDNYCKREVDRWAKQYLDFTGEGKSPRNPKMLELVDWLQRHIPSEDSSSTKAGLVHGDFQIDNLVFHPTEDKVIGILDWLCGKGSRCT
ncbi:IBA-response 3 [Heracleum sosnowskyi]|uniref:IBA-response 3 n=1 Tax=Heracleum sosnowskyi TaxID=360622 RepID=A0AAD8GP08_9APIA|nr:IBA-response 3 [Heracleum sosnowskyi]